MAKALRWQLLILCALLAVGCSDLGDPVEPEIGGDDPDSSGITFSKDMQAIFAGYGCIVCHPHFASQAALVNVEAGEYGVPYITPGDPDNSVLFQKISRNFAFGGPMPPSGSAVSQPDLDTVRTWIEEGALDN